jgi:hypothetical protein
MKKVLAIWSVVVGAAMMAAWCTFYAINAVPVIDNAPWEATMHLTAEFTTAALLIISGMGLLARARWAVQVNIFASGMLVYTLIQSPGYFLQHRALVFVAGFAGCFLLTVLLSPAFRRRPQTPWAGDNAVANNSSVA